MATPVFDGASEEEIKKMLELADFLQVVNQYFTTEELEKNLKGQSLLVICTL